MTACTHCSAARIRDAACAPASIKTKAWGYMWCECPCHHRPSDRAKEKARFLLASTNLDDYVSDNDVECLALHVERFAIEIWNMAYEAGRDDEQEALTECRTCRGSGIMEASADGGATYQAASCAECRGSGKGWIADAIREARLESLRQAADIADAKSKRLLERWRQSGDGERNFAALMCHEVAARIRILMRTVEASQAPTTPNAPGGEGKP